MDSRKAKQHVFADSAARDDAGTLHIQMRFGKRFCCAAVRTLSLSGRDIHGEYSAQFSRGSVAIEVG